jgi:hypothetical protein
MAKTTEEVPPEAQKIIAETEGTGNAARATGTGANEEISAVSSSVAR